MRHIIALAIKFAMIAVMLELILPFFTNLSFMEILYVAAAVTALAYVMGDLIILPASNNTIATIADIGLATLTIWAFNYVIPGAGISLMDALIAGVAVGIGEWLFHKFVSKAVLPG